MIELEFVNNKPEVFINRKKVRIHSEIVEGCVLIDDFPNIKVADIENILFSSIPEKIYLHYLPNSYIDNNSQKQENWFSYLSIKKINNSQLTLQISGNVEPGKWNIDYFYPVFKKNLEESILHPNKSWCEADGMGNYFNILVFIQDALLFKTPKDILKLYRNKIDSVYLRSKQELAEITIKENVASETITLEFNFPEHLKDLCKQYLSYFGRFLYDHNIDCELSLIEKNDITYMTINLDESKIDINNLKEALVGYFSLPVIAREEIVFNSQNIDLQQLIANVEHLKSQLRLANITISQYENTYLTRPIEYVLIDSLQEESKLELYGGFIKVGKIIKLKFFGIDIEFDIPRLIDKIKFKL